MRAYRRLPFSSLTPWAAVTPWPAVALRLSATLWAAVMVWGAVGCGTAESGKALPLAAAATDAAASPIAAAAPNTPPSCEFIVSKNELSSKIPTVGVVEWSLAGGSPSGAKLIYRLKDASPSDLNQGGEAPVDLTRANYRTLLLGLKQSRDYSFQIQATVAGQVCISPEYSLPRTGSFAEFPSVIVDLSQSGAREPGFIVTSSGTRLPSSAFIIDADGDIVWYFGGPQNLTRAQMDYEGQKMWMLSLNLTNQGGEMRYVSMDGEQEQRNVPGLENTHHDFTVMPGGRVAAIAWSGPGIDPESDLLIRAPDGSVSSPFKIGRNLYLSDSYHANAIHYLPADESFTISDRNPNAFVKVSLQGELQWQLGGDCTDAPAGDRCVPQMWQVNHGHHLLPDGTFVLFNNGSAEPAHVLQFHLAAAPSSFTAALVHDYQGPSASSNLGDVQRLPGGNTLVTYATDGNITELDSDWQRVQSFSVRVGYASWRPTLYGAPLRP